MTPPVPSIDLNADVGESFGTWRLGDDERLIPLVTSANVACGFHAGDPVTIARTVDIAVANGVAVGAHPGYPDLAGFGRREMELPDDELEALIVYQVGAVAALARAAGADLRHVKPHGALYNRAAADRHTAEVIARAVAHGWPDVALFGLAGSFLLEAGRDVGLRVVAEAFADRAYEPDGRLRSRTHADALLADPEAAAAQARSIVVDRRAIAIDGSWLEIEADTLCVHGDAPGAVDRAAAVRTALEAAGVRLRAPTP